MTEGVEKYNSDIRDWAAGMLGDERSQFDALHIVHVARSPNKTASKDALKNAFREHGGMIDKVSFKFRRNMVFVAKGVGKGVPISKAGTSATKREPKDWFNSQLDKNIELLADIAANNQADMIIGNLRIK